MNYYNEHDARAAQWLRELIKAGEIPAGDVDERDIQSVKSHELATYTQCHFFAGIGGWPLALKLAGWPDSEPVWTGSCPCQPFSVAGQGMGESDERHLWPDFRNLIGQRQPPVVFGEQVASAAGRKWLAGVSADMEALAYRFAAADLCAAGVGAPHRRQRLFWVADANQWRCDSGSGAQPEAEKSEGGNGQPEQRGCTGRMANAKHGDWWREQQSGKSQQDGRAGLAGSGEARRLADTASGAGAERLDDAASARFQSERKGTEIEARHEARLRRPERGCSWSNCDILPFRDGKARRVEAGTFPLAHGVSGRVGLLRGYGNAIVPQVAAEFIQAWRETAYHLTRHD